MKSSITLTPAEPVQIDASTYHKGNQFTETGDVLACLDQCSQGRPLVWLNTFLGFDATMRPDQLRALAAKLNAIADDAELRPMGGRTFRRSYRRY